VQAQAQSAHLIKCYWFYQNVYRTFGTPEFAYLVKCKMDIKQENRSQIEFYV